MGETPCYAHLLDDAGRIPDAPDVRLQRVYGASGPRVGKRFLVDRVWPRGIARERLGLDAWLRDLGPSDELRRWFGHDPARWPEFQRRYREELARPEQQGRFEELVAAAREGPVTLLFGAKDEEHNQAVVLRSVLLERLGRQAGPRGQSPGV